MRDFLSPALFYGVSPSATSAESSAKCLAAESYQYIRENKSWEQMRLLSLHGGERG